MAHLMEKALPSADSNEIQRIQRVGSVDLISRQAVLDYPIRIDHYDEEHGNRDFVLGIESVMEYVESLPSAEPKEVYCPMASRACFANGKEVAWCLTCPHISEEDRELVKKAVEGSQPKTERWIPIKWHYITDEEREENGYPKDWVYYLDCEMPEDEQEILVTTNRGRVEKDVCYLDGEFILDSGWDWIEDIVAWMPRPEPYKGGEK